MTTANKPSPLQAGTDQIKEFVAISLHPEIQTSVVTPAVAALTRYSTWFHANEKVTREVNDDNIVPPNCARTLKLQPLREIEDSEGYRNLRRETDDVEKQVQLLLKKQHMKCMQMNVDAHHHAIARIFAEALPSIADLLLADYGVEGHDKHTVVADLLVNARDDVLAFLNVRDEQFGNIYCAAHGLTSFPTSSNPPLFRVNHPTGGGGNGTAAAATAHQRQAQMNQQTATESAATPAHLRGGNDNDDDVNDNDDDVDEFAGLTEDEVEFVEDDDQSRTLSSERGIVARDGGEPGIRPDGEGLFTYTYGDEEEESTNTTSQRLELRYPDGSTQVHDSRGEVGATTTTTTLATTPVNTACDAPPAQQQLQNISTGGAGGSVLNDTAMADGEGAGGDGISNRGGILRTPLNRGGFGQNIRRAGITFSNTTRGPFGGSRGIHTAIDPTTLFEQPVDAGATRKLLREVNNVLMEIVEFAFIKPRLTYRNTTIANRRTTRIKRVATAQKTTQKADAVVDAVMQEARVDPKALQALVQDTAAEAVKAALAEMKIHHRPAGKSTSKNDKGGQQSKAKGGAQSKKKSNNSSRGGKRDGKGKSNAAKSNASPDASKSGNRSTSRERSQGNKKRSTRKRSKSQEQSRRK